MNSLQFSHSLSSAPGQESFLWDAIKPRLDAKLSGDGDGQQQPGSDDGLVEDLTCTEAKKRKMSEAQASEAD